MAKYTQTYSLPKTKKFYQTTTLNGKKIQYKLDHDPKEDENWGRHVEEIEEINDPNPIDESPRGYEGGVDYSAKKKASKVKYKCSSDDDYIEVPGGTESVTWTDEDGQSYEVDIGDLQEYDGDDGEIEYTKGRNSTTPMIAKPKSKKKPYPMMFMNMVMQNRQRIYS